MEEEDNEEEVEEECKCELKDYINENHF